MHQVATLLKQWPRMSAMLSFCVAGTALSIIWWSPVIFQGRGALPFVLFVGTPGISAGIAGWTLGKPLLDPTRVFGPKSAAIRGALIASLALLLFAPLFSILYVWTQPVMEHWNVLSLTFLVLMGSAFVAWFKAALTGAAVGWALYSVASCDT